MHDIADYDALCAHCTRFCRIMMQCVSPLVVHCINWFSVQTVWSIVIVCTLHHVFWTMGHSICIIWVTFPGTFWETIHHMGHHYDRQIVYKKSSEWSVRSSQRNQRETDRGIWSDAGRLDIWPALQPNICTLTSKHMHIYYRTEFCPVQAVPASISQTSQVAQKYQISRVLYRAAPCNCTKYMFLFLETCFSTHLMTWVSAPTIHIGNLSPRDNI